jgi:multiple sugar transport system permease protein
VVVPNSRPVFASMGTIVFAGSWNSFPWPLVIGQDQSAWTVQVVLSTFASAQTVHLHELFVAATVSILPLVAVFVLLQRHIVAGVQLSAGDD